jgi:hypothetical protein
MVNVAQQENSAHPPQSLVNGHVFILVSSYMDSILSTLAWSVCHLVSLNRRALESIRSIQHVPPTSLDRSAELPNSKEKHTCDKSIQLLIKEVI